MAANGAAGSQSFPLFGQPPKGPDAKSDKAPPSNDGHDNGPSDKSVVHNEGRYVLPGNRPD